MIGVLRTTPVVAVGGIRGGGSGQAENEGQREDRQQELAVELLEHRNPPCFARWARELTPQQHILSHTLTYLLDRPLKPGKPH